MMILCAMMLAAVIPEAREISYVTPTRVVWRTADTDRRSVKDAEVLVSPRYGQIPEGQFWKGTGCRFMNDGENPAVLLDFGHEIQGGIEIGCGLYTEDKAFTKSHVRCRIRFGESVTEAMSELKENGACNGHGMRDFEAELISNGSRVFGDTGFRFMRIDLLEPGTLQLGYVRAISKNRKMPEIGRFRSSDERLNTIYSTAVQTARLCGQRFIWDGIKRDRLVWAGDMYPQIRTILAVSGPDPIVAESLDYLGSITPPDAWMCIPSYTMWWLRGVHDLWFATGDVMFMRDRLGYLKATYENLSKYIAVDGLCTISNAVLDWPTRKNPLAAKAGHQALFSETFRIGSRMAEALGESDWARELADKARKTAIKGLEPHGSKAAAAMLGWFGLRDAHEMFDVSLGRDGHAGLSPFFGNFMLDAMSAAGEKGRALETGRDYWGGMIDMGATSFWEAFDIAWTNEAVRIDEMPVPGRPNIHADNGDFCYVGCRHSLCHGWGSGVAAWMIRNVLGIRPVEPGCRKVEVEPFLGDLAWAEGALALPTGEVLEVRAERDRQGKVRAKVNAPDWVKVVVVEE